MRFYLLFSALHLSVSTAKNGGYNIDYDDYGTTESVVTRKTKATMPTVTKPNKNAKKKEDFTDILKFVNTSEKIWVYKSTERTNDTCKVDKIEHVYELGAFMTRYHISEGHTNKTCTEAKFSYHWADQDTSHPYNEMSVPNEDVLQLFETLAYQSDDNECGVFYMNFHRDYTDPAAWIELRLKNTSLQSGPDIKCLKAFQDYSQNQNSTYTYTSQCQCIFLTEA